jgi:hypothetical protein
LSNPQVYKDGTQKWFKDLGHDETFHRVDGPAVVNLNGPGVVTEWWLDGTQVAERAVRDLVRSKSTN